MAISCFTEEVVSQVSGSFCSSATICTVQIVHVETCVQHFSTALKSFDLDFEKPNMKQQQNVSKWKNNGQTFRQNPKFPKCVSVGLLRAFSERSGLFAIVRGHSAKAGEARQNSM